MSNNLSNDSSNVQEGVTTTQPRWKSWALWLSVLGALWTIASATGLTQLIGIEHSTFTTVVDAVGIILVAFGIVNNPTDSTHI